uniref:Uncharacterized protein n=1 Tax=Arundo donax TaxID=35708 RepID=A0A0A9C8Y3_ARUDO
MLGLLLIPEMNHRTSWQNGRGREESS